MTNGRISQLISSMPSMMSNITPSGHPTLSTHGHQSDELITDQSLDDSAGDLVSAITMMTLIFCSVQGNLWVLVAIVRCPVLSESSSSIFIINLMVIGLVSSCSAMPISVVIFLEQHSDTGLDMLCRLSSFFNTALMICSTLDLALISVDRLYSIALPMHHAAHARPTIYVITCAFVWSLSSGVSAFFILEPSRHHSSFCKAEIIPGDTEKIITIIILVSAFVIPSIIIISMYTGVFFLAKKAARTVMPQPSGTTRTLSSPLPSIFPVERSSVAPVAVDNQQNNSVALANISNNSNTSSTSNRRNNNAENSCSNISDTPSCIKYQINAETSDNNSKQFNNNSNIVHHNGNDHQKPSVTFCNKTTNKNPKPNQHNVNLQQQNQSSNSKAPITSTRNIHHPIHHRRTRQGSFKRQKSTIFEHPTAKVSPVHGGGESSLINNTRMPINSVTRPMCDPSIFSITTPNPESNQGYGDDNNTNRSIERMQRLQSSSRFTCVSVLCSCQRRFSYPPNSSNTSDGMRRNKNPSNSKTTSKNQQNISRRPGNNISCGMRANITRILCGDSKSKPNQNQSSEQDAAIRTSFSIQGDSNQVVNNSNTMASTNNNNGIHTSNCVKHQSSTARTRGDIHTVTITRNRHGFAKALRTVMMLVLSFFFLWGLHFISLAQTLTNNEHDFWPEKVRIISLWLGVLSYAMNPFLYGCMNRQIREELVRNFRSFQECARWSACCCCWAVYRKWFTQHTCAEDGCCSYFMPPRHIHEEDSAGLDMGGHESFVQFLQRTQHDTSIS